MRPTPRLDLLYGKALLQRVTSARVLMVGAGGIGCELLKNLVMSGFRRIEVVDLDTIDLSNLNRQFLFQKQHIKLSKANVAREAALQFNPSVDIRSHHANIKDQRFDVNWFRGFDLVTNALDNLDARRHVNRMCLAANVPLIESGTAGYLGQATVIQPGQTECFDCQPKPTPTTFPICTIRSTPTAPIHCIVWAKNYLFTQLFDRPDDDDNNSDNSNSVINKDTSSENASEIAILKQEAEALGRIRDAMGQPNYAKQVFQKAFHDDIVRLASMEEMWQTHSPPIPLRYDTLNESPDTTIATTSQNMAVNEQRIWSINECFHRFINSTTRLGERLHQLKQSDADVFMSFDKDDDDALNFVTSAANLRAHMFGIELKSRFDVKSMAGSIIPAIASTNAIIAGIIVMQAMRLLEKRVEDCKTIYLAYGGRRDRLFYPEQLQSPNPGCYVCRNVYITLPVDGQRATLGDIVDRIVVPSVADGGLGLGEEVTIMEASRMLYDADWDDNKSKTLVSLGLTNGKLLSIVPDDNDVMGEGRAVILILAERPELATSEVPVQLDGPVPDISRPANWKLPATQTAKDIATSNDKADSKKRKFGEIEENDSVIQIEDDDIMIVDNPLPKPTSTTTIVAISENEEIQSNDAKKKRTPAELDKLRRQLNGVFAVNKPVGLSSYDVVDRLKHLLFGITPRGTKKARGKFNSKNNYKIGHGGTLDPLASGVLVIGVNKGTKSLNDYLSGEKIYVGEGLLGSMTDTYDSEGHLEMTAPYAHVTRDAVERVLDQFRGTIQQMPPKYSALKVNGRPMYDYARKGEEIPRELVAREVTIYSLELEEFTTNHNYKPPKPKPKLDPSISDDNSTTADTSDTLMITNDTTTTTNMVNADNDANATAENQVPPAIFRIRVSCSGGTYIRSLIYDIGQALGSTAHMVSLSRVQQGCFKLGENVNEIDTCNIDSVAESIEASQQLIKNVKPSS